AISAIVDLEPLVRTTRMTSSRNSFGQGCGMVSILPDLLENKPDQMSPNPASVPIQCPRCREVTHHFDTQVLPNAAFLQHIHSRQRTLAKMPPKLGPCRSTPPRASLSDDRLRRHSIFLHGSPPAGFVPTMSMLM